MVCLADFVSSSRADVGAALATAPPFPPHLTGVLLTGPDGWCVCVRESGGGIDCLRIHIRSRSLLDTYSGKTSLLFHFARAAAAATGRQAFILTTRERADDAPPLLPAGVGKADPAYEAVCMK